MHRNPVAHFVDRILFSARPGFAHCVERGPVALLFRRDAFFRIRPVLPEVEREGSPVGTGGVEGLIVVVKHAGITAVRTLRFIYRGGIPFLTGSLTFLLGEEEGDVGYSVHPVGHVVEQDGALDSVFYVDGHVELDFRVHALEVEIDTDALDLAFIVYVEVYAAFLGSHQEACPVDIAFGGESRGEGFEICISADRFEFLTHGIGIIGYSVEDERPSVTVGAHVKISAVVVLREEFRYCSPGCLAVSRGLLRVCRYDIVVAVRYLAVSRDPVALPVNDLAVGAGQQHIQAGHAVLHRHRLLGAGVNIDHFAVLPADLKL